MTRASDSTGSADDNLFPAEESAKMRGIEHALRAHYRREDPWRHVPAVAPTRIVHRRVGRFGTGTVALAILAALAVSVSVVLAASGILDLGKPTNAVSPNAYFPLSGFRHDSKLPTIGRKGGKAQVLFIGTLSEYDESSAEERWPVVKALEQFGELSNVHAIDHNCDLNLHACTLPTYDWAHARYRSKYLSFEHKDLFAVDSFGEPVKPYQRLSRSELTIFKRLTGEPDSTVGVQRALFAHRLPIVAVGDYEETSSQDLIEADFDDLATIPAGPGTPAADGQTIYSGLSFQAIQSALATGRDPVGTHLNADVNAEANIITALICHADGNRPGGVCSRGVIKSLARRLH